MRATIVVDDNVVLVDGIPMPVDCQPLVQDNIHAVQWYGDYGEVEFKSFFDKTAKQVAREPNEFIEDFSAFQPYVDLWKEEKAKQEALAEEKKLEFEQNLARVSHTREQQ